MATDRQVPEVDTPPGPEPPISRPAPMPRAVHGLFLLLVVCLLAVRVSAIRTDSINWDEFGLFARAVDSSRSGELKSGGRPGLGVLVLLPLVSPCEDEIQIVHRGRLLWFILLVGAGLALWWLVRLTLANRRGAEWASWLALALWVGAPIFSRWSLQVRTDQPAIALGLAGGVALIASRRWWPWAIVAGAAFGAGYLFSQKLVYVMALSGLLAAGRQWLDRDWRLRRESLRAFVCAAAGLATVGVYFLVLPWYFDPPSVQTFGQGLRSFDYYRSVLGTRVYRGMLPTLIPHGLVLGLLVLGTVRNLRRLQRETLLAWAVLALGLAVALFHSGALPYFWMTLGLFPAAAAAMALPSLLETTSQLVPRFALLAAAAILAAQGVTSNVALLEDSQAVQRESLEFVRRQFPPAQLGFHPEHAPFCRPDPERLPFYITQKIVGEFTGRHSKERRNALIEEFRDRPVHFILESYRLEQFPFRVKQFWEAHYVPYRLSVAVPGFHLRAPSGQPQEVEVIVPGSYRLLDEDPSERVAVLVGPRQLVEGESIELDIGWHPVTRTNDARGARLLWALDEPPGPLVPFYGEKTIEELRRGRASGLGGL